MHKPYALVSGITKKSLQPIDGRKEGRTENLNTEYCWGGGGRHLIEKRHFWSKYRF